MRSLLTGIPVALFAFVRFKFEGSATPAPQGYLKDCFQSPVAIAGLILAPVVISLVCDFYEWAGGWLRDRQANYVPEIALTKTLVALNSVVGRKINRFGECAKRLATTPEPLADVIRSTAMPEVQIDELVEQIWLVLTSLMGNPNLKVALVAIEGGVSKDFCGYSPKNKRPSDELLSEKENFFAWVAKNKSFQVIDDIGRHIEKRSKLKQSERDKRYPAWFVQVDGADDSGSICGFPVIHSHLREVIYVLTVKADTPKEISGSFKDKYSPVIEHFLERIVLEHSLKLIQKHAN